MAITNDAGSGGNYTGYGYTTGWTTGASTLTSGNSDIPASSGTNRLVIVDIASTRTSAEGSYATISTVTSSNMGGLTFSFHKRLQVTTAQDGAFLTFERWYGFSTSTITTGGPYPTITITASAVCDNLNFIMTYWAGVNSTTPFDTNGPFFTRTYLKIAAGSASPINEE